MLKMSGRGLKGQEDNNPKNHPPPQRPEEQRKGGKGLGFLERYRMGPRQWMSFRCPTGSHWLLPRSPPLRRLAEAGLVKEVRITCCSWTSVPPRLEQGKPELTHSPGPGFPVTLESSPLTEPSRKPLSKGGNLLQNLRCSIRTQNLGLEVPAPLSNHWPLSIHPPPSTQDHYAFLQGCRYSLCKYSALILSPRKGPGGHSVKPCTIGTL